MAGPNVCAALYRAKDNMNRGNEVLSIQKGGPPQTPMDKLESAIVILGNKTGKWCKI